jgi:hypothetical protein
MNITPTTLNLGSQGNYVTVVLEFSGYDNTLIDATSIKLQGTLSPVSVSSTASSVTVKFDRAAVAGMVSVGSNIMVVEGTFNGTPFVGSSIMNVL